MRPLLLHEERVPPGTRAVDPRRDRLGELVGHAVVQSVGEVLVVGVPVPVARQVGALVADLHAVRAGDIGGRGAPVVRAAEVVAPVLRAVVHAWNIAVRGAAAGALFDDANEIARHVPGPFRVARSVVRRRRSRRPAAVGSCGATTR